MQVIKERDKETKNKQNRVLYIVAGVLIVILIILIVLAVRGNKKADVKKEEIDKNVISSEEQAAAKDNVFEKDAYPEVKALAEQYYNACATSDFDVLGQIVSTLSEEEKQIIQRKSEYVEAYQDVEAYVKKGPIEKSYLVFATYNMKFINLDTTVPGMDTLYVRTDENGRIYIYKGQVEAEVSSYINTAVDTDDAKQIISQVNDDYLKVLSEHNDVLAFIEKFEGNSELVEQAKTMAADAATAEAKAKEEQEAQAKAAEEERLRQEQEAAAAQAAANATQMNESVAAVQTVNVRESNNEAASRVGNLYVGDTVTRVSMTEDGWSKIQFDGGEGYAKSEFLSKFSLTEDRVKATTIVNVRSECSETANIIGQLDPDLSYTRNATYENGWSQIVYDGGVGYVKSDYLTK